MASMKVQVTITGLAYCYYHDRDKNNGGLGQLEVAFLYGAGHSLKFSVYKSTSERPIHSCEVDPGTEILFTAYRAKSVEPLSGLPFDDYVVNIDRLHDPVKNLPLKEQPGIE